MQALGQRGRARSHRTLPWGRAEAGCSSLLAFLPFSVGAGWAPGTPLRCFLG